MKVKMLDLNKLKIVKIKPQDIQMYDIDIILQKTNDSYLQYSKSIYNDIVDSIKNMYIDTTKKSLYINIVLPEDMHQQDVINFYPTIVSAFVKGLCDTDKRDREYYLATPRKLKKVNTHELNLKTLINYKTKFDIVGLKVTTKNKKCLSKKTRLL